MERWEYQVIHLNVEAASPPPSPPAASPPGVEPAPGAPPVRVEAVFSKEYLEKEFPGFYSTPPAAGAPSKEHPASQLRGFLNLQGRDGWQLLGFYPVGQLQMMIFRRPLQGEPASAPPAAPAPALDRPGDGAVAAVQAAAGQLPDPSDVLERILVRLEALEQRLPPASPPLPEVPPSQDLAAFQDGAILPPQRWGELDGLPRLSTSEAARALGFRSAASLLNLAARSGYSQGLVKRGADAALAVYMGREKSGRGGRDRRLWVVLRGGAG
jgi:hypothetical protein